MGKWLKAHRPTPALVVAVIALAVAATGVATALPGKNKVDSGDIANGEVSSKDLNKKAKAKWAHVNGANGSIYSQSGGISAEKVAPGVYYVNFRSSVRGYAIHATASNPAGNQDVILSASRCGEAAGEQQFCSPESRVNPKWVNVHTVESDLDHRDSDFWITAIPK
jgi:hypothetical protein